MVENKKPLLEGESNINHTFIITQNINDEQLLNTIPSILRDVVLLLRQKHINTPTKCILNVLISKMAQMITSKRVQYQKVNELGFPNWYSIIFMGSGIGKDYLVKDLDRLIFKNFSLWFDNKVELYKYQEEKLIEEKASKEFKGTNKGDEKRRIAFIQTEKAKIRNIFKEVSAGTQEGFYSDSEALSIANFGSIFLKISELGAYLNTLTTESKLFFNCLYEAYDGKITSKSIKGENRKPDLNNIPTNILLYSDPNMFKGELQNIFDNLMLTGIGRRAVISFRQDEPLVAHNLSYTQIETLENDLNILGENLHNTFINILENSIYKLDVNALDKYLTPYQNICIEKSNNINDEIAKREINSRFYKALKLSCLYACLNHPTQLNITSEDLQQAIITIEALGTDLEVFTNYKPKHNDKYDRFFLYFKKHIGEKISKTKIKTEVFKEVGISRAEIRNDFENIINCVAEIAQSKDYYFISDDDNKNKNLQTYCLMPIQDKKNELEELLNKN